MNAQIPLSFPITESMGADDFMQGECNKDALDWIERFPNWPYPVLIIYGEKGCGKSHLLEVWKNKSGIDHKAMDDADQLFGNKSTEEQLFHEFNLAKENQTFLLLTMQKPVAQQNIQLPDLISRLRAAPAVEIRTPDDVMLETILVKLLHDRQLKVEPGVINYIVPRIERSFLMIRKIVEMLDMQAMAGKRSITIPLASDILQNGLVP